MSEAAQPILLRLRSGKTAAKVVAFGFGGGTMILGVATVAAEATRGLPVFGTLLGHAIAASPFIILAIVIALCRSELWVVPSAGVFRLLTYRPWRASPRVEDAPITEYAGVRIDTASEEDGGGVLVSLVTTGGDPVPVRQFRGREEADAQPFATRLAEAAGLWVRSERPDAAAPSAGSSAPT